MFISYCILYISYCNLFLNYSRAVYALHMLSYQLTFPTQGNRDIEIAGGWQLTCWFSSYVGKRKLDLWGCLVGRADMYMRDRLHLSG